MDYIVLDLQISYCNMKAINFTLSSNLFQNWKQEFAFSASWSYVYLGLVGLTTNVNVVHCCKINNFKGTNWFILLGQLIV